MCEGKESGYTSYTTCIDNIKECTQKQKETAKQKCRRCIGLCTELYKNKIKKSSKYKYVNCATQEEFDTTINCLKERKSKSTVACKYDAPIKQYEKDKEIMKTDEDRIHICEHGKPLYIRDVCVSKVKGCISTYRREVCGWTEDKSEITRYTKCINSIKECDKRQKKTGVSSKVMCASCQGDCSYTVEQSYTTHRYYRFFWHSKEYRCATKQELQDNLNCWKEMVKCDLAAKIKAIKKDIKDYSKYNLSMPVGVCEGMGGRAYNNYGPRKDVNGGSGRNRFGHHNENIDASRGSAEISSSVNFVALFVLTLFAVQL